MFYVVTGLVLTLFLFIFLGFKKENGQIKFRRNKKQICAPLGLAFILFGCFTTIPANSVGIQYSPFTGVSDVTLPEGFRVKNPFDTIYKLSTEVQTQELSQISSQTKDAQFLTMNIDIKYRVNSENAYEIFKQFRTLDNMNRSLISPTVQRSIESVTTQYNVIDILGEKRNEVYTAIEQDLAERLEKSGVSFYSMTFVDTDAGDAIEQAIQEEAVAKKAVETAEQERLRVEIEAQQKVVQAQADQDAAKIEAETKVIQAQADAEANRVIAASLTPELIDMMEAEARKEHGWVTVQGGTAIVDARESSQTTSNDSTSSQTQYGPQNVTE